MKKQAEYQDTIHKINMLMNPDGLQQQINNQTTIIQQLTFDCFSNNYPEDFIKKAKEIYARN